MCSSRSPSPNPKRLKTLEDVLVSMEDSKNLDEESPQVMEKNIPSSRKLYQCNRCKCKFSSPQALGGHQNAHKQERKVEKDHNKEMKTNVNGFSSYFLSGDWSTNNNNFYPSFNNGFAKTNIPHITSRCFTNQNMLNYIPNYSLNPRIVSSNYFRTSLPLPKINISIGLSSQENVTSDGCIIDYMAKIEKNIKLDFTDDNQPEEIQDKNLSLTL